MQHLVKSQQFDRKTLQRLFESADALEGALDNSLHGKIVASLFYEPSTRTRFSFESAAIRLGGNVLTTENARDFSSAAKGETLEDTIRIVNNYADIIVLRHYEAGASERAAAVSKVPIINAGDGAGQHPTQGLLDLYTIQKEMRKIDGLHIAIVGDLKYGRTVRSLAYLLGKYENIKVTLISPPELPFGSDIKSYLKRHNVTIIETADLASAMKEVDVVYQTRIQKERFPDIEEYNRLKGSFVITRSLADSMKPGSIIMHPLPRVDEIEPAVDDSPHAAYFKQAGYGVLVRMGILKWMLNGRNNSR